MSKIQVYTTRYCPYCRAAKALLDNKGYSYQEITLDNDPDRMRRIMTELNWRTVPIIMIDGKLIGGYDDLARIEKRNELGKTID